MKCTPSTKRRTKRLPQNSGMRREAGSSGEKLKVLLNQGAAEGDRRSSEGRVD